MTHKPPTHIPWSNVVRYLGLPESTCRYYVNLYPPVKTIPDPHHPKMKLYDLIDVQLLKTWLSTAIVIERDSKGKFTKRGRKR